MNYREAEELWRRLKIRPWRTLFFVVAGAGLAVIVIWATAYLQEDARLRAAISRSSSDTTATDVRAVPLDLSRVKDPLVRQRCQVIKYGPLKAMSEILSTDPEQRKRGMVALFNLGGFSAAIPEVEYLYENLPPDDPGREGVRLMLEMARKASRTELGQSSAPGGIPAGTEETYKTLTGSGSAYERLLEAAKDVHNLPPFSREQILRRAAVKGSADGALERGDISANEHDAVMKALGEF